MAGHHDLRTTLCGNIGQQVVDITLAQDFQMRIGFVEQQHRARVGEHEGQQHQHLLATAPRRGKVQLHSIALLVLVGQRQFCTLFDICRVLKPDMKQGVHLLNERFPSALIVAREQLPAEVSQHLRCLAFANQDIDFSGLFAVFSGGQTRHGGQKHHRVLAGTFGDFAVIAVFQTAVKRLFVCKIEL